MSDQIYGGGAAGPSAYEIYVEVAQEAGDPVLSKSAWIASLRGPAGIDPNLRMLADFEAVGDGDADDTAALQAAAAWMLADPARWIVDHGAAVYKITATISGTGSPRWVTPGATILVAANVPAFAFAAPASGPYPLSADYVTGALTIAYNGDVQPYAGQRVKIASNALDPAARDEGSNAAKFRQGEQCFAAAGSTLTALALTAPLRFVEGVDRTPTTGDEALVDAYTVANGARIWLLDDAPVMFKLGALAYEAGHDVDWAAAAVTFTGHGGGEVDLKVTRGYAQALRLIGCCGITARVDARNLNDNTGIGQTGYAVATAGCLDCEVQVRAVNVRHAYTSSTAAQASGSTALGVVLGQGRDVGVRVVGGYGAGVVAASPFDTHHESQDATFERAVADGCGEFGLTIRGVNVQHLAPQVRNCAGGALVYTEYDSGDPSDDYFTNSKAARHLTSAVIDSPDFTATGKCFDVSAARLSLTGSGRYATQTPLWMLCDNGAVRIKGSHAVEVGADAGTAGQGLIHVAGAEGGSAAAVLISDALGGATVTIEAGAVVEIDARAAGVVPVGLKTETGGRIVVRGTLRLLLPAGATLLDGAQDSIICEGLGQIEYSIGADATLAASATGRPVHAINIVSGLAYANAGRAADRAAAIGAVIGLMSGRQTDYRLDTVESAFRRVEEWRQPPGGGPVYEVVIEKSLNTTGAGYALRFLAGAAASQGDRNFATIQSLCAMLMDHQHVDNRKARYGGYALAPKDGTASAYNAAMIGLGLLAAYRVIKDPRYLHSCRLAAQFLETCNNPNPVYLARYGETPIPALPENASWNGFCDQISAGDTILTCHSSWNLLCCKFLLELYEVTGDGQYLALCQATRDWGAAGVTGYWDFWTVAHAGALPAHVSNNWFATGLTVSDGQWHRRGEASVPTAATTGACQGATSSTVMLAAGASAVDGAYTGMAIQMTSGAAANKGSIITAYDGATRVATIRYPLPATPTAGDSYKIGWAPNTIGTDQMEYGIEALHATGYDPAATDAAYLALCSYANADTGAFGAAYDSRICWPGYFRIGSQIYGGVSRAYGSHYDVQGIGPLLRYKKDRHPAHYAVALEKALLVADLATFMDQDWQPMFGADESGVFDRATIGMGTVRAAIAEGLVKTQ